jgi:predicted nucleic acid-binding protein
MVWVKPHYLDASALVKLFVEEDGSDTVRHYFNKKTSFYTTSICFAEALGALKRKYEKRKITQEAYLKACNQLVAHISLKAIDIDDIGITDRRTYWKVDKTAEKYNLDISDALQILTLKEGYFSKLAGKSRPILITADLKLADAARQEELRVWYFMEGEEPDP